ncbi:Domain unknown function DUF295 [Dillenia turbinata]|uniref:F-box domain-containing protein n=1 Tax=Dillenia turbinata TaxID=194707 RepID=A0AAN8W0M3_9MAGN
MEVDWSQLNPELLETIAKKLKSYADYFRFRSVCRNWKSSVPKTPRPLPCQLPWLMLPQNPNRLNYRAFFNLSNNKVLFLHLPEAASNGKRRCGSSHGWLVLLDETPVIFLLNPLTRARIYLPPLNTFPNVLNFSFSVVGREYSLRTNYGESYRHSLRDMRDTFIKKVIVSSNPSEDSDFIALAILNHTEDLAFCRKGDKCWKFIDDAQSYSEDVIYNNFDKLFYAVNKYGSVAVCDVNGESPKVSIIEAPEQQFRGDMQYLASWDNGDGEFLLISRYLEIQFDVELVEFDGIYRTVKFEVFKLDLRGSRRWEKVRSLGDRMVFIGENSSLCLAASDFLGCKGNCIYFTDDFSEINYDGVVGEHDLGVFSLDDGDTECPLQMVDNGK